MRKHIVMLLPLGVAVAGLFEPLRMTANVILICLAMTYIILSSTIFNFIMEDRLSKFIVGLTYAFICCSLIFIVNQFPLLSVVFLTTLFIIIALLLALAFKRINVSSSFPIKTYLYVAMNAVIIIYFAAK